MGLHIKALSIGFSLMPTLLMKGGFISVGKLLIDLQSFKYKKRLYKIWVFVKKYCKQSITVRIEKTGS